MPVKVCNRFHPMGSFSPNVLQWEANSWKRLQQILSNGGGEACFPFMETINFKPFIETIKFINYSWKLVSGNRCDLHCSRGRGVDCRIFDGKG